MPHVHTIGAAKQVFAGHVSQKPQLGKEELSTKSPYLAQRLEPSENLLVYEKKGRMFTSYTGQVFRTEQEFKAVKPRELGYGGSPWLIVPINGSAFICHDMWSEEIIPIEFTDLFKEHVNTFVCRRATQHEVNTWFAGVDLAEVLDGAA